MNGTIELVLGKKGKRSKSLSLSEDCLEELENIVREEQNKLPRVSNRSKVCISTIVETACWRLINERKK